MRRNCCTRLSDWFKGTFMAYLCPEMGARSKYSPRHEEYSMREMANDDNVEEIASDLNNDRLTMMIVKHSFVADGGDELPVEAGQIVYATHEENQWVYALTESGKHGRVPYNYLTRVDSRHKKDVKVERRSHRHIHVPRASYVDDMDDVDSIMSEYDCKRENSLTGKLTKSLSFGEIELGDFDIFGYISEPSIHHSDSEESLNGSEYSAVVEPFVRKPCGKYLVLHNYHGEDENDATIYKGDCVTVLNKDDYDWYYIQTSEGTEGFVPRNYLWQATCAPDDDIVL